jgi:hypothetical protein
MAKLEPRTTPEELEIRLADALQDHKPFWPSPYFYTDMAPVNFHNPLAMADRAWRQMSGQSSCEFDLQPGQQYQVNMANIHNIQLC